MAPSRNLILISGNVSEITGNDKLTKFQLTTPDQDKNGKDTTQTNTVIVFGELGQACFKSLKDGDRVYLEGKLTTNQDKQKEIIASSVQRL